MPKEEVVVETPAKGIKGKKGRVAGGSGNGTPTSGRGRPPATVSSTVSTPVATTTGNYLKLFWCFEGKIIIIMQHVAEI